MRKKSHHALYLPEHRHPRARQIRAWSCHLKKSTPTVDVSNLIDDYFKDSSRVADHTYEASLWYDLNAALGTMHKSRIRDLHMQSIPNIIESILHPEHYEDMP